MPAQGLTVPAAPRAPGVAVAPPLEQLVGGARLFALAGDPLQLLPVLDASLREAGLQAPALGTGRLTPVQQRGAAVFDLCLQNVLLLPRSHTRQAAGDAGLALGLCDAAAWTGDWTPPPRRPAVPLLLARNERGRAGARRPPRPRPALHASRVISTTIAGASAARRSTAESRSAAQRDASAPGADPAGGLRGVFVFEA